MLATWDEPRSARGAAWTDAHWLPPGVRPPGWAVVGPPGWAVVGPPGWAVFRPPGLAGVAKEEEGSSCFSTLFKDSLSSPKDSLAKENMLDLSDFSISRKQKERNEAHVFEIDQSCQICKFLLITKNDFFSPLKILIF